MSVLIGGSGPYSTWGKLRCTYARNTWDPETDISDYNSTYISGFKSEADGSGLIRIANYGTRSVSINQPRMRSTLLDPGDGYEIYIQGGPGSPSSSSTVEVVTELTGETMTFDSGSVTLAAAFFDYPSTTQTGASPSGVGDIVSVGKLTAF